MSVSITTAKVSYTTDSSQVSFPITFDFRDEAHIEVILRDISTEVETVLILGTDYFVNGTNVETVPTYDSGYTLMIRRASPSVQESDYVNNDALDAEVLETNFDALVLRVQELEEKITRALLMKKSTAFSNLEFPEPQDGYFLEWTGTVLVNKTHYSGADGVATAFAVTILDDISASEVRATIGATGDSHDHVGGDGAQISVMGDVDSDTKIQMEESADEDVIRMDVKGTELVQVTDQGVKLIQPTPAYDLVRVDGRLRTDNLIHYIGDYGEPAFQNSWYNYAFDWAGPLGFRKDAEGFVWIRGFVYNGTPTSVIFVLPYGYRPLHSERDAGESTMAYGETFAYRSGNVIVTGTPTTYMQIKVHGFKPTKWHLVNGVDEPPYTDSWTQYTVAVTQFCTNAFLKDENGKVSLRGLAKSGSLPGTVYVLPTGYRPSKYHLFPAFSNGAIGRLDTRPDGSVRPEYGSNVWFSLDKGYFFPNEDSLFTNLTLENSWVVYNANWHTGGYYKDSYNFVHLRGLIKNGTARTIATLPVGYRPAKKMKFPSLMGETVNTHFCEITINTDGTIVASGTDNLWLTLSGINFSIDAADDSKWTNATFQNDWVNYDATTYFGAQYYVDPLGWVHLRGVIKNGTVTTTAFSVPTKNATTEYHTFIAVGPSSGIGGVTAEKRNVVGRSEGANTFLSLDGIAYLGDANL